MILYHYRYDQLNRIKEMQAYNGLNISTNSWSPTGINDYKELISYDPNGNILTYFRNGASATGINMDKMKYDYKAGNNQLNYVYNIVPAGNYSVDIDAQSANNYQYDAIGNLIKDISEGMTGITWNVYGKISFITKTSETISYTYDTNTTSEQLTAIALGEMEKGKVTKEYHSAQAIIINMPDPTSNKGGIRIKNFQKK